MPDLSAAEAIELVQAGRAILVDVRTKEEMDVSMIEGAISKKTFEASKADYSDKLVIPYCTIGARSGKYTKELAEAGIAAKNLRGSVLSWSHENLGFTRNGKPTKKIHVFDPYWDLVANGFTAVH